VDIIEGKVVLSPRDLISELECSHRLTLDLAVKKFDLPAPKKETSAELELLEELGKKHEAKIVERLRAEGNTTIIGMPAASLAAIEEATRRTRDAIESGVDTIIQASLFTGDFVGYADFLVLAKDESGNPIKDSQGRNVYNPVDAKSARSEKRGAILQVAAYAYAMREMGLATPTKVHLWLGGDKEWSWPADDLMDLAEEFTRRVRERVEATQGEPEPLWEAPRESCVRCRWIKQCESGRIAADDISLTQGIRSTTRLALIESGIKTMGDLASATKEQRPRSPKEVSEETFNTLVAQADIQVRGRTNKTVILSEPKELLALGLLPEPSPGDIWFDMEGDPFGEEGEGLEYMFGYTFLREDGNPDFATFDALDREGEKEAFEDFIAMVLDRQSKYPDMHIYHYAAYEPSRMGMLSQRHGTYEREVDQLLRSGIFIDLYSIVRKAFRFSSDSISIKDVEQIYQGKRVKDEGVTTAVDSVIQFEAAVTARSLGDQAKFEGIYAKIREYNKVDCDSTRSLDHWLRGQAEEFDIDIAAIRPMAIQEYSEKEEAEDPIAIQLMEGIPANADARTPDEQGLALLASAVSFHWREQKPVWWNIFDRAKAEIDQFDGFNDVVLATTVKATPWSIPQGKRNFFREVTIQADEVEIDHIIEEKDSPHVLYETAPSGFKEIFGTTRGFKQVNKIIKVEGDTITFQESIKDGTWADLPMALIPPAPINTRSITEVLRDHLGTRILLRKLEPVPLFPNEAWADLLLKRYPRQLNGAALPHDATKIEDVTRALRESDNSYVAVQGPPGTGKTYLGKHVIAALVKDGWRIGVTAQSHAVIENILDGVVGLDPAIPVAKKQQSGGKDPKGYHNDDVPTWALRQSGGFVIGGTVWTFSSNDIRALGLDLMVIDEAGQFSLANTLAAASGAKRTLLLGDPQQLPQVSLATHPEPIEISVLSHIMGDHKTIPDEYGYFLDETHRMHPDITKYVSRLQYENRLHSDAICVERELSEVEPGLHVVNVEHSGNTVKSEEEAEEILKRIPGLLGISWVDADNGRGKYPPRPLLPTDIIVVAAYNRQVRHIKSLLASNGYADIRVGTVDKFQGQEAPVVFVSMATSSSEDLPRGIEFLLSPNRLNVAISRAQWACYLLRSPQLARMEPSSAKGMVFLGKFISLCRR